MQNYGELKTAIGDWMDRADLTTKIPEFVRLAETDLYRNLRCEDNEFSVTLTQADDPKNPISLPQNFTEFKLVTFNDCPLQRISDAEYQARLAAVETGSPYSFAMIERQLYLHPWTSVTIPATNTDVIDVHYWGTESIGRMADWLTAANPNTVPESDGTASTTAERGDAATTRLFLRDPDIYLAGGLAYGYLYLQDPKKAKMWKDIFEYGRDSIIRQSRRAKGSGSTSTVTSAYGN